ncbi:MAG: NADH-quinone oxidoreductase subunit N [Coriobacteriia bacterium]|nr:NADH-quinone oxidoreductase subunit N [Coriobacteriia bacterium]
MQAVTPTILWVPGAVVLVGIVIGLVAEASGRRSFGIATIAAGLLVAAAVSGWSALETTVSLVFGGLLLGGGGFSGLACVVYVLAGLSILSGWSRATSTQRGGTVAGLTALSAVGIQVLASSFDLLTAVLALEIVAIAGYALVSATGSRRSDEAAMRYFVQGGTATGFTVLGLAVLYGVYGYSGYTELVAAIGTGSQSAAFGMVLVLAAFAFKLGAVPFHSWAPDVFETTDASSAGFLASAPKIGALMALLVLFPGGIFNEGRFPGATLAIATIAAASVVLGNVGALRQRSLGRMLGYSGIAQVGYGLIGVAAGVGGITATAVFAVTYAVGAAAAFFVAEAVRVRRPDWDGTIAGLSGLAAEAPVLAAGMTVAVLSLTGMPLMIGFWGKLLVFSAAVSVNLTWLAVVGVIGSVISFGYYGSVIRSMYAAPQEAGEGSPGGELAGGRMAFTVALVAMIAVIIGGTGPVIAGVDVLFRLLTF